MGRRRPLYPLKQRTTTTTTTHVYITSTCMRLGASERFFHFYVSIPNRARNGRVRMERQAAKESCLQILACYFGMALIISTSRPRHLQLRA
jgi:hypothetical protein